MPFCFIVLIIADITSKNTPLNLAGMAIERYIAICDPLHHAQVCTVHRTYIAIGVSWGVGAVPAMSDLSHVCSESRRERSRFGPKGSEHDPAARGAGVPVYALLRCPLV
ncbi:hypothetical protein SKAU_G00151030 [Synaphobranchus kaupii]|uniref:G-protein coupled receptors family 1 profile domain-containing protein n=1 Tax=Synaphobranchus kaupii TaxID=118154 RepID=A0A9Q1IYE9_SYNKA|nr:hypothetical protein SKAU_G00151030 [Synaphobranchus kaupii]